MLNVTKELTALARKLGYTGKAPDTVAKAINAITASIGEGGGGGGSGTAEPFIVNIVEGNSEPGIYRTDKTYQEIFNAHNQNRNVVFVYEQNFVEADLTIETIFKINPVNFLNNNYIFNGESYYSYSVGLWPAVPSSEQNIPFISNYESNIIFINSNAPGYDLPDDYMYTIKDK